MIYILFLYHLNQTNHDKEWRKQEWTGNTSTAKTQFDCYAIRSTTKKRMVVTTKRWTVELWMQQSIWQHFPRTAAAFYRRAQIDEPGRAYQKDEQKHGG